MRLLIAVKSCRRDQENGSHIAIRRSWKGDVSRLGDVRFFTGEGSPACEDEIVLSTNDSYQGLAIKTRKILEWSVQHGYDFTLLADNDTFVVPERLQGFEQQDYSGKIAQNREVGNKYRFCHGGYGYFVSGRLAELVVKEEPKITDEDRYVGQVAHHAGILPVEKVVGYHFPKSMYSTRYHPGMEWQELMYRKFCLGEEVEVYSEDIFGRVLRPGEVLVRMKNQAQTQVVSKEIARRLVYKGLAHVI